MASLARCGEGFRVDSRSMPRLRREGRTLHSRSTSRDLLTGAQRPFAWSEGPPVPRYSSARLRVRLRRLRFACDGDTANRCSWKRCNRRGSGSHSPDTRTPRRGGWRHGLNPQVEHRFEVLRGSTWTASTPCSLALYANTRRGGGTPTDGATTPVARSYECRSDPRTRHANSRVRRLRPRFR